MGSSQRPGKSLSMKQEEPLLGLGDSLVQGPAPSERW